MAEDDAGYGAKGRQKRLNKAMDTLFPQESKDACRVCTEPVVDGRWNYCSERCREIAQAVQKMFIWDAVREMVLNRDDHTCQECGLTKEMWLRAFWYAKERAKEEAPHPPEDGDYDAWRQKRREVRNRYGVDSPKFHVDHITRIADGGHPFDESNLQTLCKQCHHEKTAEENSSVEPAPEITLEDYLEA